MHLPLSCLLSAGALPWSLEMTAVAIMRPWVSRYINARVCRKWVYTSGSFMNCERFARMTATDLWKDWISLYFGIVPIMRKCVIGYLYFPYGWIPVLFDLYYTWNIAMLWVNFWTMCYIPTTTQPLTKRLTSPKQVFSQVLTRWWKIVCESLTCVCNNFWQWQTIIPGVTATGINTASGNNW